MLGQAKPRTGDNRHLIESWTYLGQPLSGLAPDASWFEQYGFRGGKLSEDQIRIQGYGVPSWSPYYRTGGPKNVAESLASRAPSRLPTTREE